MRMAQDVYRQPPDEIEVLVAIVVPGANPLALNYRYGQALEGVHHVLVFEFLPVSHFIFLNNQRSYLLPFYRIDN